MLFYRNRYAMAMCGASISDWNSRSSDDWFENDDDVIGGDLAVVVLAPFDEDDHASPLATAGRCGDDGFVRLFGDFCAIVAQLDDVAASSSMRSISPLVALVGFLGGLGDAGGVFALLGSGIIENFAAVGVGVVKSEQSQQSLSSSEYARASEHFAQIDVRLCSQPIGASDICVRRRSWPRFCVIQLFGRLCACSTARDATEWAPI